MNYKLLVLLFFGFLIFCSGPTLSPKPSSETSSKRNENSADFPNSKKSKSDSSGSNPYEGSSRTSCPSEDTLNTLSSAGQNTFRVSFDRASREEARKMKQADSGTKTLPRYSVCSRSSNIQKDIISIVSLGLGTEIRPGTWQTLNMKTCSQITAEHLQAILLFRPAGNAHVYTRLRDKDFSGMTSLRLINLSQHQITEISEHTFAGLTSLQDLYISENLINQIHPKAFQDLISLQSIMLSDNRLTSLPSGLFSNNPCLKYIWLDGNNFSSEEKNRLRRELGSKISQL